MGVAETEASAVGGKAQAAEASRPASSARKRYDYTSLWARTVFSYVSPMLDDAAQRPLEEHDADWLCPPSDTAEVLARDFGRVYTRLQDRYAAGASGRKPWTTLTLMTLLRLYWWPMVVESLWVLTEVAQRLGTPVALREFLRWLEAYDQGEDPPEWEGWVWAVVLGICGFAMAIIHHQLFWYGMRAGFQMRQQVVTALHSKVLRLNAAAVSAISSGHVVNLVSNDVRRFDDAMPFWIFLWAAPLELVMVLIMVALELDWVSSIAGVATSLAMIPLQSSLVRYIGGLRRNTAKATDERVRLAGEVIEGALAMKMLSWEDPFTAALQRIRGRETHYSRQMARIRALNFALQFCITPIVAFVTFAVYRARNGTLNVPSVFYALSLLNLPKLYMVNFFVMAIQSLTELRVSLQRIDAFLTLPEPPHPAVMAQAAMEASAHAAQKAPSARPSADCADAKPAGDCQQQQHAHDNGNGVANGKGNAANDALVGGVQEQQQQQPGAASASQLLPKELRTGCVALRGADYDWLRPFGSDDIRVTDTHGTALGTGKPAGDPARGKGQGADAGKPSSTAPAAAAAPSPPSSLSAADAASPRLTLHGVCFEATPGELLGICGGVGSGKSSVLAALLGELQPLKLGAAVVRVQLEGAGHSASCAQSNTDAAGAAAAGVTAEALVPNGISALDGPLLVGSVAYCAQVPWIVAGSVRDNIVFGRPWDEAWYARVVRACCLTDDLEALPAGDATELGERGINLSGGQKARVAMARACYSRPAVALLDDPLSAVDPRVGRQLFAGAIGPGSLLEECGTTRILVTHQRQYLPQCDRVLVLRGGQTIAQGSWQDIAALGLPELTAGHGGTGAADANGGGEHPMDEVTVDMVAPEPAEAEAPPPGAAATDSAASVAEEPGQPITQAPIMAEYPNAPSAFGGVVLGSSSAGAASTATTDMAVVAHVNGVPDASAGQHGSQQGGAATPAEAHVAGDPAGGPPAAAAAGSSFWAAGGGGSIARFRLSMTRTLPRNFNGAGAGSGGAVSAWRSASMALWPIRAGSLWRSSGLRPAGVKSVAGSEQKPGSGRLILSEDRATGSVSWRVYGSYCWHLGLVLAGFIVLAMFAGQGVYLASEWWLALWAREDKQGQQQDKWLVVYGILTAVVIVLALVRSVLFFEATMSAATSIHNAMARCVLRAPLSFFHTNPTGRIVNRFSKDQGQVDDLLPMTLFEALQCGFQVLGAFVLVSIAVPVILPVFVPLTLVFYWVRRRYIGASRDIKRWEAVTRSPIFASFHATLKGLPTIRAYAAQQRFHEAFLAEVTANCKWYFALISSARWIGVRLDAVSASTMLASSILAMVMRDSIRPTIMALALTHTLQLTGVMQWFVRQTAEVENSMTSVERMLAYTKLESEPPRVAEGGKAPPAGWPRSGALEYRDVSAVYRPGLPPVLSDVTFSLPAGSSCGVVGRTGSGKSSLMLTLFRLIDVTHGSILLDGLDVATLGLDALRRQLAIIPQDPVLFSGTLRSNLDPWGAHADARLWEVLQAVQLQAPVQAMPGGLDARMAECGDNLSVGQRQLFCLARALLQDAHVLALDEATANVDRATDALIQGALRDFAHRDREQHGRVLLVIAHRIDTVMDCDALLVLAAGRVAEFGAPEQLAAQPGGTFARMVAAARHAPAASAAVA